jgi:UDP:flavonoid glycosyltransferase YjiC (YdhE family)
MNPALSILDELIKNHNYEAIIFCSPEFKDKIEGINAKYIEYEHYITNWFPHGYIDNSNSHKSFFKFLFSMSKNINQMIRIVEEEKPDLIFYDKIGIHNKVFLHYMKAQIENGSLNMKMPPTLALTSTFMFTENDLKGRFDKLSLFNKLFTIIDAIKLLIW